MRRKRKNTTEHNRKRYANDLSYRKIQLERAAIWRKENPERNKTKMADWYKKNRKAVLLKAKKRYHANIDKSRRKNQLYRKNNRIAHSLRDAKRRARLKGWKFNVEEKDIIVPIYCPYLGIKLTHNGKKRSSTLSIDRIDSKKGYVKGNVQVISLLANTMKTNASVKQMIMFAENVLRIHKK